jgi:hypothetical protein
MIKYLLQGVFLFILISCNRTDKTKTVVEYVGSKQRLSVNNTDKYGYDFDIGNLQIAGKDSVLLNKKSVFKLIATNPDVRIVRAYLDCETENETLVDTVDYTIEDCTKQLTVINDTIVIQFVPTILGKREFQPITTVTVDKNNIVRILEKSFTYLVTE